MGVAVPLSNLLKISPRNETIQDPGRAGHISGTLMNQWSLSSQEGTVVHASVCCLGPLQDRATLVVSVRPGGSQFSPLPRAAPLDGVRLLLHPYVLSMTLC